MEAISCRKVCENFGVCVCVGGGGCTSAFKCYMNYDKQCKNNESSMLRKAVAIYYYIIKGIWTERTFFSILVKWL